MINITELLVTEKKFSVDPNIVASDNPDSGFCISFSLTYMTVILVLFAESNLVTLH